MAAGVDANGNNGFVPFHGIQQSIRKSTDLHAPHRTLHDLIVQRIEAREFATELRKASRAAARRRSYQAATSKISASA
jgi:hypothetical protein